MIGCFSPISSITVFLASLKHRSSTLDADVSIKSSSSSSASVVSSDSCYILDRRLRHNLEKKPWICTLDNHSVPSNILSPSMVQAVLVSFVTCSGSCLLSVSDIANQLARFPSFLNKLRFLRKEAFFPTVYKCVILGFCAPLTRPSMHVLKTWIGSILNFWIELS